jgi:integrase
LKRLGKNSVLDSPKSVESFVLNLDVTNKTKNNYFNAYGNYCKANEIEWERPSLRNERYPVKVPTEERIDLIISSCTPKYSTIFQLSKYGLRPHEISKITLRDLDLDTGDLLVRSSKLGLDRTLKLRREVVDLLKEYINKYKISKLDQRLFALPKTIRQKWRFYRKRAYKKFRDPELLKIRLYDLRHWYATTTYLKTRDIFFVKYLLGHRNIQSTLIYMHIAKGLTNYAEDYTVKVASTLDKYTSLLEQGFEYISDYEDKKILRKRK